MFYSLTQYATGPNAAQMPSDIPLFNIFNEYIGLQNIWTAEDIIGPIFERAAPRHLLMRFVGHAIDARLEQPSDSAAYAGAQGPRISQEDMLGLQASLLQLVTRCHPTHVEYVREVFARADALLSRLALNRYA